MWSSDSELLVGALAWVARAYRYYIMACVAELWLSLAGGKDVWYGDVYLCGKVMLACPIMITNYGDVYLCGKVMLT